MRLVDLPAFLGVLAAFFPTAGVCGSCDEGMEEVSVGPWVVYNSAGGPPGTRGREDEGTSPPRAEKDAILLALTILVRHG